MTHAATRRGVQDAAVSHEPHCPVPRAEAQGEGAACLCVSRSSPSWNTREARAVKRILDVARRLETLADRLAKGNARTRISGDMAARHAACACLNLRQLAEDIERGEV